MVETVMIFALGFLAATLIALLIIPAINARAERLARRRVEALFPLSIPELTAEKDHLRAEFAVLQRRLERKVEEAHATKHRSMEEFGRHAVRISSLETSLAERDETIAGLEADLREALSRLAATEQELTATQAALSETRATLAASQAAHQSALDEISTLKGELASTKNSVAALMEDLASTQDRLEAREAAFAALDSRHTASLSDLDAKRITISDLETRLMMHTARGDDFERALSTQHSELVKERERANALSKNLTAEQERGVILELRIRDLEHERDRKGSEAQELATRLAAVTKRATELTQTVAEADDTKRSLEAERQALQRAATSFEADIARLGETHSTAQRSVTMQLEEAKADKAAFEGALSVAHEEQAKLERELQTLRKGQGMKDDAIQAENEELRRKISELADLIMRTAESETPPQKRKSQSAK